MSRNLQSLLDELKEDNSLKAWSLIITFFGDSVAPRGGAVSAATIQQVMTLCGIGAGTVRTALSRLGKDGWVLRTKAGRNSFYRLSKMGISQSSAAATIIFSAPTERQPTDRPLYLCLFPPDTGPNDGEAEHFIKLQKHLYLLATSKQKIDVLRKKQCLITAIEDSQLPEWISNLVLPAPLADKYQQLIERFQQLSINNEAEAIALRTLLIHEWRRLRLRPGQPATIPAACQTVRHNTHRLVADIYQNISPLADRWLSENALGPQGILPPATAITESRFC